MRCSGPSFRLLGLAKGKLSFVPELFITQRSFASSRVATVLSLECSNTAIVRSFLEFFPGVLMLRLTTERATGEYRGYGRAGVGKWRNDECFPEKGAGLFKRPSDWGDAHARNRSRLAKDLLDKWVPTRAVGTRYNCTKELGTDLFQGWQLQHLGIQR